MKDVEELIDSFFAIRIRHRRVTRCWDEVLAIVYKKEDGDPNVEWLEGHLSDNINLENKHSNIDLIN